MNSRLKRIEWLGYSCIFLLFVGASLMLVMLGARVYQNITIKTLTHQSIRTPLSYVTMKVRQYDTVSGIRIDQVEAHTTLVLGEVVEDVAYETWLYAYEGYLREVYIVAGDEVKLEDGEKIIPLTYFSAQLEEGNKLKLSLVTVEGQEMIQKMTVQCVKEGIVDETN